VVLRQSATSELDQIRSCSPAEGGDSAPCYRWWRVWACPAHLDGLTAYGSLVGAQNNARNDVLDRDHPSAIDAQPALTLRLV
jgi:hypothetical protein